MRRRGIIVDVPEGAVAGSRAIVSLPDDGSARHATVTIAFPPGLSTGRGADGGVGGLVPAD